MRKILSLTVCCVIVLMFTANAQIVGAKEPRVLSPKDVEKIKDHLDRIIEQATASEKVPKSEKEKPTNLSAKADSLNEAQKLVQDVLGKDRKIMACVEHDGWFIFGMVRGDDLRAILHEGYAVKKGNDSAYHFGFW